MTAEPETAAVAAVPETATKSVDPMLAEYDKIRSQIPPQTMESLKQLPKLFPGIELQRIKIEFARVAGTFIRLAARVNGPVDWTQAIRSTNGILGGILASQTNEFFFQPITVNRPMKASDDPEKNKTGKVDWRVRAFGLARCIDKKVEFDGPTSLMIYNFGSEKTAAQEASRLVPGHVFSIRAKLSDRSPRGKMGPGQIGWLNGGAADPIREIQLTDGLKPFGDPFDALAQVIPLSNISELVLKPVANAMYRIEGEISRGYISVKQTGQFGTLVVADDSINGSAELVQAAKGGLSVFLAPTDVPKAQLAIGSRVAMILSGYESKKKDAQGDHTGNKQWSWNASITKVLLDLSQGTEIADPDTPAAAPPVGISRDVM